MLKIVGLLLSATGVSLLLLPNETLKTIGIIVGASGILLILKAQSNRKNSNEL